MVEGEGFKLSYVLFSKAGRLDCDTGASGCTVSGDGVLLVEDVCGAGQLSFRNTGITRIGGTLQGNAAVSSGTTVEVTSPLSYTNVAGGATACAGAVIPSSTIIARSIVPSYVYVGWISNENRARYDTSKFVTPKYRNGFHASDTARSRSSRS